MLYFKFFIFLFFSVHSYSSSLVAIVSLDSNINSISKKELSKIFLSKTKKLPNDQRAFVVETDNKKFQKIFYEIVSNKNPKKLRKYWTKMIFTGRGQPSKKLESFHKIVSFVAKKKNAISYVPIEYVNDDIKIILEIK